MEFADKPSNKDALRKWDLPVMMTQELPGGVVSLNFVDDVTPEQFLPNEAAHRIIKNELRARMLYREPKAVSKSRIPRIQVDLSSASASKETVIIIHENADTHASVAPKILLRQTDASVTVLVDCPGIEKSSVALALTEQVHSARSCFSAGKSC
jgi:hypothetical protein